jgi:hypothetical protein
MMGAALLRVSRTKALLVPYSRVGSSEEKQILADYLKNTDDSDTILCAKSVPT